MNNFVKSATCLLITLCVGIQLQAMEWDKQAKKRNQQLTEDEMLQLAIQESKEMELNLAIALSLKETKVTSTTNSDEKHLKKALSLQNSTQESKASNKSDNVIDPTTTEFFKNKKYQKSGTGTIADPYVMDLSSIIKKQKGSVCGVHSLVVTEWTLKFLKRELITKKLLISDYRSKLSAYPTQEMVSKMLKSVKAKNELVGEQIETISQNRNITDHSVFQNLEQTMQHGFIGLTKKNLSPTISFLQKLKNTENAILALSLGDMITKREKNTTIGTSGHWITIVAQFHNGQVYLYYFDSAKSPNKTRKNKHLQSVKNLLQIDPKVISSLPTLTAQLNDIKQNLAHSAMNFEVKLAFINQFIVLVKPFSGILNDKLLVDHKPLIKEIAQQIKRLCSGQANMPQVFMDNIGLLTELCA
jgi:hypothetical protein